MKLNKNQHYKHQLTYFEREFSAVKKYELSPWQASYINRIKHYVLHNNYKNKTLLDIATGSGYVAIEMAKMGMNVIACDLSPQAIKNLEKYKKQYKLKNLKLLVCKAEKIPLRSESVDYIVANAILEHIPAEKETIHEWKRVLRKKGRMFITVPLNLQYIWPFLWIPNILHDKRIGHLRRYDLTTLKKKFALPIIKHFYTGHIIKVFGVLISLVIKNNTIDQICEDIDNRESMFSYGANNISVIFEK